jgi:hypothetical protein
MDKFLGKEYGDLNARKTFLKDNCDVVEEFGYMKQFSPDKVLELKERLAEVSIEINDKEEELNDIKKDFKFAMDPLKEEKLICLKGIKERAEFVKEVCYTFIDQESKMVGTYNSEGDLISQRPAMPKELQGTIFQIDRKTGTNN